MTRLGRQLCRVHWISVHAGVQFSSDPLTTLKIKETMTNPVVGTRSAEEPQTRTSAAEALSELPELLCRNLNCGKE
jgi:hypothetical protein